MHSHAAISLMPQDFLKGARDEYDVIVIGSGLAGLTAANTLARAGHSVLLLEQHYKLGGLATWFKRPGGHIFDISLHGFPVGMIKSCRRYWTDEIADSIVQLQEHPLRQSDVLADHHLQPRGLHAAAGRAVPRAGRNASRRSSTRPAA